MTQKSQPPVKTPPCWPGRLLARASELGTAVLMLSLCLCVIPELDGRVPVGVFDGLSLSLRTRWHSGVPGSVARPHPAHGVQEAFDTGGMLVAPTPPTLLWLPACHALLMPPVPVGAPGSSCAASLCPLSLLAHASQCNVD
eukprot:1150181-Pelagomonas_calceolata.AAC.2